MMQRLNIAIVATAWAFAIYKFKALLQGGRNRLVIYSWAFILFFALCMTFQVDLVYRAFDSFTGVNNLSWLAAYTFLALAIYSVSSACCEALGEERPRWMPSSLILTLALLGCIFLSGISTSPEWPLHLVPRNTCDLLFMELMFLYAISLGAVPLISFARFTKREEVLPTRIRMAITLSAVGLAISFFMVKVALSLLGFLQPSSPLIPRLSTLTMLLTGGAGLLWSLTFAPNRLHSILARPLLFLGNILALRDMKPLVAGLERLCPPVVHEEDSWWDWLRDPEFHLYRMVVRILDGKKTLADRLNTLKGSPHPELADRSAFRSPWDEKAVREAVLLHQALEGSEKEEFQELVACYRGISRSLRLGGGD